MKKLKYLSLLIIAALLAGCAAETANNSATATLNGTQAVQTASANSTLTSEAQSPQTQGQATPAPTAGNTSVATATAEPTASSSSVQNEIENGPANKLLRIDNYVYISSNYNSPDKGETYRIDVRSGQSERINDVPMYNMMYHNGWIYYTYYIKYGGDPYHEEWNKLGFCRMKPDGSQKDLLCELPCALRNMFIQDGYLYAITDIYYSYDDEYYDDIQRPVKFKMNSNGSLGNPEYIFSEKNIAAAKMLYYGDSLYYTRDSGNGAVETEYDDFGLYRCRLDGTGNNKIGEILNGRNGYSINEHYWFCIYDNWIYYGIENLDKDNSDAVYKMRLDGSSVTLLCDKLSLDGNFNYMDGWVYFTEGDWNKSASKLCRVRDNGAEKQVLFECGTEYSIRDLTLTEDYIICSKVSYDILNKGYGLKDINIYRMNLDGSNKVELKP